MVAYNVRLCGRVTGSAISDIVRASTRCIGSTIVPIDTKRNWLVQGDPMLNSVTKCFETKIRIVSKITTIKQITYIVTINLMINFGYMINFRLTYIILEFKNPPYSSSSACGRSQWKSVTKGTIPGDVHGVE